MTRKYFYYPLVFIILFIVIAFNAGAQGIKAQAGLKQYTIRIGDQTKLFLSVSQTPKDKVSFPVLKDTLTDKLLIVRTGKPDTIVDAKDKNSITVTQSYTITSFDAGNYVIKPFAINTNQGVIKTVGLSLNVESVKVDTTKAIYDIKQPIAVSYTFLDRLKDNWYWIVAGILIVLIAGGLIWYVKTRPKPETPVEVVMPAIPAHTVALAKLKALRDKKLWQQDEVKQYYIELSDVLREYLEKRYQVSTHEKTTDEIFISLKQKSITNEDRTKLKKLLLLADLVKFAKERPLPTENEESIETAINFVKSTQIEPKPANKEGGKTDV